MKTIKPGSIQKVMPWWVGIHIDCQKCKATFELEERDLAYIDFPASYRGRLTCNTSGCGTVIEFDVRGHYIPSKTSSEGPAARYNDPENRNVHPEMLGPT